MAYYYENEGYENSNKNETLITTTVPTPTPKIEGNNNTNSNETELYSEPNDLLVPEVTEEFLGNIDKICVYLRYLIN